MVGILKVQSTDATITPKKIRQVFQKHGASPTDIHIIKDINKKPTGSCFLCFEDREEARLGLNVDGQLYKNQQIVVKESGPSEFHQYFPGISFFSKPPNMKRSLAANNRANLSSSFEKERFDNDPRNRRDRSRSPLNKRREQVTSGEFFRNFGQQQGSSIKLNERRSNNNRNDPYHKTPYHDTSDDLNLRKYVKIEGFQHNVTENAIKKFFRPILIRDILFLKHASGKFVGKPNGTVIVEFFEEYEAEGCILLGGERFKNKVVVYTRAERNEIIKAMQDRLSTKDEPVNKQSSGGVVSNLSNTADKAVDNPQAPVVAVNLSNIADMAANNPQASEVASNLSSIAGLAVNNPQVAHLLNLLTDTVNAIATGSSSNTQTNDSKGSKPNPKSNKRGSKPNPKGNKKGGKQIVKDPIVNRVAHNANIDVKDISMGKVVGIRNLPSSVTPGEILQFFQDFDVIRDSVRIHQLDDGKCSGDGIITFERRSDAEKAVAMLDNSTIARKAVTLFLL